MGLTSCNRPLTFMHNPIARPRRVAIMTSTTPGGSDDVRVSVPEYSETDEAREEKIMTAVMSEPRNLVDRQELTVPEIRTAIANAIKDSGCTLSQLEDQARAHRFESLSARLSWMTISTLRKGLGEK